MNRRLIAIVEREDGTTYYQEIEYIVSVEYSVKQAQQMLGDQYYICNTFWSY